MKLLGLSYLKGKKVVYTLKEEEYIPGHNRNDVDLHSEIYEKGVLDISSINGLGEFVKVIINSEEIIRYKMFVNTNDGFKPISFPSSYKDIETLLSCIEEMYILKYSVKNKNYIVFQVVKND